MNLFGLKQVLIIIMIRKKVFYDGKLLFLGHTSGDNSGASSPAWRSPSAERRRPPDMPVGVNIRSILVPDIDGRTDVILVQ